MHYFSTNGRSRAVSFREAVLTGQPVDGGLYFPAEIARLPRGYEKSLGSKSREQIAFDVIRPYVGGEIDDIRLFEICSEAVAFPFPLIRMTDRTYVLELFHGPTLAFKDVGARFMSRCIGELGTMSDRQMLVVVATSGDTGGAVAAGFHGSIGVQVVVLFPKGKVSRVQELQLTTLGGNVLGIEVDGDFDECQALAKRLLSDPEIRERANVTSANSINIARWLPQQFYYFFAFREWDGPPPVISVPSGNFGNLAAGVLTSLSGLPASRFIAACNANDVIPEFLASGVYRPRPSVPTLSNAMDVGDPSNFVRLLKSVNYEVGDLRRMMDAVSITDEETIRTIREAYDDLGYVLDPHGAVGYRALQRSIEGLSDAAGYFLETAHPVKFDSVSEILAVPPDLPPSVSELFGRTGHKIEIPVDYEILRSIVTERI